MGFNKKGQGISLNFIIIAALALIALIVIALFFTGGIQKLFKKEADVIAASEQEFALAKTNCKFWCSMGIKESYDNPAFSDAIKAAGIKKCDDFADLDWAKDCTPGTCTGSTACAVKTNERDCVATKYDKDSKTCVWT